MSKYKIHGLDVWGNAKEGYDINDVFPACATIDIPDEAPSSEVIKLLKQEDVLDTRCRAFAVTHDENGLDFALVEYKGRPILQFRKVQ